MDYDIPFYKNTMKYNNVKITPQYALLLAYNFLFLVIIYFFSLKYLSNNNYFKWGPPIKIFQIEINSSETLIFNEIV